MRSLLSRRGFLSATAGTLVAGCATAPTQAPRATTPVVPTNTAAPQTTAVPTLAAATASAPAPAATSPATGGVVLGGVRLPTYLPAQGPKPDLPSPRPGIDDGFTTFPRTLYASVTEAPARAGEVVIMAQSSFPPFNPFDQNPAWQEVNRQLGADVKIESIVGSEYPRKFSVVVAGGALPDMFALSPTAGLPEFLKRQCADLTPHLSGDAAKDYPNLANIPTLSWRNGVFAGGIYGVPATRSALGSLMYINKTRWDKEVGSARPNNADDWKRMLLQLTHPQSGQWGTASGSGNAFGLSIGNQSFYGQTFGAPNIWRLEPDGKLTHTWETVEFKAALGYVRDLYLAGVYHPNSLTYSGLDTKNDLVVGKFASGQDQWISYNDYWQRAAVLDPQPEIRMLAPFTHDGVGQVKYWLGRGVSTGSGKGVTVLKQAGTDRVKELLRILNYLAAPFGSRESLLLEYGVEGPDFTFDAEGNPIFTERGAADTYVPWRTITQHPQVLYDARFRDWPRIAQADQQAVVPLGIGNPVHGYYSPTEESKGSALTTAVNDGITDIVAGRRPFGDYSQLIEAWRSGGGEQIRQEYQRTLSSAS